MSIGLAIDARFIASVALLASQPQPGEAQVRDGRTGAVTPTIGFNGTQAGQRQRREDVLPFAAPTARLASRIDNRIDSRLETRIGQKDGKDLPTALKAADFRTSVAGTRKR